jgi:hypothetical protein
MTTAKVPIFLESVQRTEEGIDKKALREAVADSAAITVAHCFGTRSGLFKGIEIEAEKEDPPAQGVTGTKGNAEPDLTFVTVGKAFEIIRGWVNSHFGV